MYTDLIDMRTTWCIPSSTLESRMTTCKQPLGSSNQVTAQLCPGAAEGAIHKALSHHDFAAHASAQESS